MTKNKYDLTCSILQAYLKYEEDSAKLQGYINAKDNLELTSNWSQLQIDYQNLVAIPVAEQQ
jgi:TorA maturation chaperone TorD